MDVVFVIVGIDPDLTASTAERIMQNRLSTQEESSPFLIGKRTHKSENIYVMHAPSVITSQEFSKLKETAAIWGRVLVLVVASFESGIKDTARFLEELEQPLPYTNARLIFTNNSHCEIPNLDHVSEDAWKLFGMFASKPVFIDETEEDINAKTDELVQFAKRQQDTVTGKPEQIFDDCKKTIKCIILGSKKSGKSSLGNVIVNRRAFKVNFYDNDPTTEVKTALMNNDDSPHNVLVVDTPSELDDPTMKAIRQIEKTSEEKYVLVFSFEDMDIRHTLKSLESKFANLRKKAIIAITYTDELANIVEDDSEKAFKKYIEKHNKSLSKLLLEFGNRHVFVSNVADPSYKQGVQRGILQKIENC